MKKHFVTYEIALKLKELGFDEKCIMYYLDDEFISEDQLLYHIRNGSPLTYNFNEKSCQTDWVDWDVKPRIPTSAPLCQQVIDWLLEKYQIHIEIELTDTTSEFYFQYCIVTSHDRDWNDEDCTDSAKRKYDFNLKFDTRYECIEKSILKVIELIKSKNYVKR